MTTSEHTPPAESAQQVPPAATTPPPVDPPPYATHDALRRSRDKVLGGVIAGLAERARIDTSLVRLLAVVAFLFSAGTVTVAYVATWLLIPGPDSPSVVSRWQRHAPAP